MEQTDSPAPSATTGPTKACRYCKKEIPKTAARCPHCRGDLRSWPARHPILTTLIAIVFASVLLDSMQKANEMAAGETSGVETQPQSSQSSVTQASNTQPASSTDSASPGDATASPSLVRRTVGGVVRTSTIDYNSAMGMNQQVIIFGGDADAVNDGSGSYCIINGQQYFVNVVEGDTITATGEGVPGNSALINCRVDSIQ